MRSPSFRLSSILLIMLSLSIGLGIRGNYGHEYGAMIAGALAGMTAALMSGREDWRHRMPYFAFLGALGWAFGGSIAYMHPPAYTETGHLPTQVYGFLATFFQAFLWAGLGGAATAYAAGEDREKLTAIFRPLIWVFGFWALQYVLQDTPFNIQERLFRAAGADHTWFRQRNPLYWLDSGWLEGGYAFAALCLFFCLGGRAGATPGSDNATRCIGSTANGWRPFMLWPLCVSLTFGTGGLASFPILLGSARREIG